MSPSALRLEACAALVLRAPMPAAAAYIGGSERTSLREQDDSQNVSPERHIWAAASECSRISFISDLHRNLNVHCKCGPVQCEKEVHFLCRLDY